MDVGHVRVRVHHASRGVLDERTARQYVSPDISVWYCGGFGIIIDRSAEESNTFASGNRIRERTEKAYREEIAVVDDW